MRRGYDVVSLVFGLLLTAIALGYLYSVFVGALDWATIKIAAPLALVAVGVLGLALSRPRR